MKKIICILLALSMVFAFAACGGNGETPDSGETITQAPAVELTGTLEEITAQIYSNATTLEMMLMDPMEIDLADIEVAGSFIGVSSTDSIERAVYSEPMIGSIAYSMCLVKAKEGADVEALKNEILEGVNYRKWICVAAEKVLVTNCGNTIMMIMAAENIVDDVYNAFNIVANGAASAPLTKAGEVQEEIPYGEEFPAEDGMDTPAAMPGEGEEIILG
ncbi:MAG: hypothetical protein IJD78_09110 [Clostridia bacterium]|nr:hypothetical protein [Clostridia bacterium]